MDDDPPKPDAVRKRQFGCMPYDLADSGRIGRLSEGEAKLALALAAHANRAFEASPGTDRLAQETGMRRRSVQRAARGLVAKGVLHVQFGGGKHRTNRYTFIANSDPRVTVTDGDTATGESPLRDSKGDPGGAKGRPTAPQTATPRSPEQKEQNEQPTEGSGGVVGSSEVERKEAVLRRVGITGNGAARRLAEGTYLSALQVAVVAASAPGHIANIAGWLRTLLQDGAEAPRMTPKLVCKAIRLGYIERLGDVDVAGHKVTQNEKGLTVYDGTNRLRIDRGSLVRALVG